MITIKADKLQDGLYNIKNGKIFKYKAKGGTVRTYDMGEIVRCKDCKWSDWYKALNGEHRCYCMVHGSMCHTDDDYCSYGERGESEVEE